MSHRVLKLHPPLGPLSWLFPELELLEPSEGDGDLDLRTSPLNGSNLLEFIEDFEPEWIELPRDALGETMALWLRGLIRRGVLSCRVRLIEGVSLETRIRRWCRGRETAYLTRDAEASSWSVHDVPLDENTEDEIRRLKPHHGESLWLWPLRRPTHEASLVKWLTYDAPPKELGRPIPLIVEEGPQLASPHELATRMPASFRGLLLGEEHHGQIADNYRQVIGRFWPERRLQFLALEHYALAGIDIYYDSLIDRITAPQATPRPKKTCLVVAVCGTDGSGKSTHVAALESWLKERGVRVRRHKIYRHGVFHDTVTDLTRQCDGDRHLQLWRWQRVIKVFDTIKYFYSQVEKDLDRYDVLLFDRYTPTHLAAGLGRYQYDPYSSEILSVFPKPDLVFFLDAPIERALVRISQREERTVDENPYMLQRYRDGFHLLAERHRFVTLDATAPFERNRDVLREAVARELRARTKT